MDATETHPQCLDAEGDGLADQAEVLPGRLDRYAAAKARATEMLSYLADQVSLPLDMPDRLCPRRQAHKLSQCGNWLVFHHYYTLGEVRLVNARFCKEHLLCPLCAIRRGSKMLRQYLGRLDVILEHYPHLKPFLVTLTVKNGPNLAERFAHLHSSVQRLHKRRHEPRTLSTLEQAGSDAAVWSYEVTNRGNGWHPHCHAIHMSSEMPDPASLTREWLGITGDSYIVDSRPISSDPARGFMEVFKYAMKFSELTLEDNWEAFLGLQKRRLIGSYGLFRGIDDPASLVDDPITDAPYVAMLYRYFHNSGYHFEAARQRPTEPPK